MDTTTGREVAAEAGALLDGLVANRLEVEQLLRERRLMIHEAHSAGATWAQIAQALGVSRQAVYEWQRRKADADPGPRPGTS